GYRVLTESREVGPDIFVKQLRSHFIFFQGHPEYDPLSLHREYRRDVSRFLAKERETYPTIPSDYFDAEMERSLTDFQTRAWLERSPSLITEFPRLRVRSNIAEIAAKSIFQNWLGFLADCRP